MVRCGLKHERPQCQWHTCEAQPLDWQSPCSEETLHFTPCACSWSCTPIGARSVFTRSLLLYPTRAMLIPLQPFRIPLFLSRWYKDGWMNLANFAILCVTTQSVSSLDLTPTDIMVYGWVHHSSIVLTGVITAHSTYIFESRNIKEFIQIFAFSQLHFLKKLLFVLLLWRDVLCIKVRQR